MDDDGATAPGIRDYLDVLRRRKTIVVLAMVGVVGAAMAMVALTEPVYQAEARLLVQSQATDSVFDPQTGQRVDPQRLVATEIEILESEPVEQRVQERLGLDRLPPQVSASPVGQTDVVAVRVRSTDPTTAQLVADAYAESFVDLRREQAVASLLAATGEIQAKINELQTQIDAEPPGAQRDTLVALQAAFRQRADQLSVDAALRTGGAQVVAPAERPNDPVEPQPLRTAVLAIVLGLILGVGAALLIDHLDDSIKGRADIERLVPQVPLLAAIPTSALRDRRPLALDRPGDPAVEPYRSLRTAVQFLGIQQPFRVLQITSSIAGEGKTTIAINLAAVFSRAGTRVALVDADLRRPRLREVFGVSSEEGLTSVLLGRPLDGALHAVPGLDQLVLLPAGPQPPNPSELLGSNRMAQLMSDLRDQFDLVLLDSSPLLPVADSMILTAVVDSVLLVVQERRTTARQLNHSLALLDQAGSPPLGVVLNRAGSTTGGYGYGYGYGYGHRGRGDRVPAANGETRGDARPAVPEPLDH